jgi:uncharacterized protein (DUF2237 family)
MTEALNILGSKLMPCCYAPVTGFYRSGYCATGPEDLGMHTVCIEATAEFLEFSKEAGNDLSTPNPDFDFPGLHAGDRWCLCAPRWLEAYEAGMAPKVILEATHQATLQIIPLRLLRQYAIKLSQPQADIA